jgi:hypothetical protein
VDESVDDGGLAYLSRQDEFDRDQATADTLAERRAVRDVAAAPVPICATRHSSAASS